MTVQEFIDALGGSRAVADALDIPLTTVRSWADRNSIPLWRMPRLAELALKQGKPLPAHFQDKAA